MVRRKQDFKKVKIEKEFKKNKQTIFLLLKNYSWKNMEKFMTGRDRLRMQEHRQKGGLAKKLEG